MRVGDRYHLADEGIFGEVIWARVDELTGDLLGFCVAMDDGRFAAIDPTKIAAGETLQ